MLEHTHQLLQSFQSDLFTIFLFFFLFFLEMTVTKTIFALHTHRKTEFQKSKVDFENQISLCSFNKRQYSIIK